MALEDFALADMPTARLYVTRQADDDAKDAKIEFLVNAFSAAIRGYCNREWKPTEDGAARLFHYDGEGQLDLAPYELRSLDSIVVYRDLPAADRVTLLPGDAANEADYRLMPLNGDRDTGTFTWLILPRLRQKTVSVNRPIATEDKRIQVEVTGDWGAGVVPWDVELALLIAVKENMDNPAAHQSASLGEYGFTAAAFVGMLPPGSRRLLSRHRVRTFA